MRRLLYGEADNPRGSECEVDEIPTSHIVDCPIVVSRSRHGTGCPAECGSYVAVLDGTLSVGDPADHVEFDGYGCVVRSAVRRH
jgi:hypothetical protein